MLQRKNNTCSIVFLVLITLASFSKASNNKFNNGEFTMIGLDDNGTNIMRAYSIASANHESHLEFLSIKVKDGPLTSKLQNIQIGDDVLVNSKSTGTLVPPKGYLLIPYRHWHRFSTFYEYY